jgi:tRNA (guanine37-N1)-methyltransferase
MLISIITLFPEIFPPILNSSILGRAQKKGLMQFEFINLRQFGDGVHQVVDDKPYGGGVGMVFKADVLEKAWQSVISRSSSFESGHSNKQTSQRSHGKTILMSASGKPFTQQKARELSRLDHLVVVCGHYEGVDQRFVEQFVDEEISIGDYVLTGGELPAMVVADAVTRLVKGVLDKPEATIQESFEDNLLEYPHFTRPKNFNGQEVPPVLLSGNHQEIARWRKDQAIKKTKRLRPDLLKPS